MIYNNLIRQIVLESLSLNESKEKPRWFGEKFLIQRPRDLGMPGRNLNYTITYICDEADDQIELFHIIGMPHAFVDTGINTNIILKAELGYFEKKKYNLVLDYGICLYKNGKFKKSNHDEYMPQGMDIVRQIVLSSHKVHLRDKLKVLNLLKKHGFDISKYSLK